MFKRRRKEERQEKDQRLRQVAKEHVRHLSGETAKGRVDPATTERTGQEKGTSGTSDEGDTSR
ncbi:MULTISPECIES: hypothetical protein [Streptomyces]|uniref:Uncharacterized protein n=1 Tax=Streptomyces radiopugnans TaxID=403935 RepID=A0A1H9BDZ1_9ACTN|nr:hypothetical protein [Streptomyces radiopugnans]SEP87105.1 hypothetical protein SAMN05216481_102334 [Streptomyces radiopugnans]